MISNVEVVMEKERHRHILEGEIKGRQEVSLKITEIARKLLLRGHSIVDIMELTDLSAEEVEKLTKNIQ